MSHSPADASGRSTRSESDSYRAGWEALFELMYNGGSFSGRERSVCFLNTGTLPFADISSVAGIDFPDDGRGMAITDWDGDGDLDVWTVNRSAPRARLLLNESPGSNAWVAFRVRGVTCNRDGIGARVTVRTDDGRDRVMGVRAGEGYLAQSSLWAHFGLGSATIESVTVRWPGGETETFDGVTGKGRYVLEQGTGRASPVPARAVALEASEASETVEIPAPTSAAHIRLPARVPLLGLSFVDSSGERRPVEGPVLLNLWASWCVPCKAELRELGAHEADLRGAGLEVLALTVDEPEARATAMSMLDELEWPFGAGVADGALVSRLDSVLRALMSEKTPMPVPTSFLIDGSGRLAAVYKGVVSSEDLLADASMLEASESDTLAWALPFDGRWLDRPSATGLSLLAISNELTSAGDADGAAAYLNTLTSGLDLSSVPADAEARAKLAGSQLNLGVELSESGRTAEALAAFDRALELRPGFCKAVYNRAVALRTLGRTDEAAEGFGRAVACDPANPEAWFNLGDSLAALGQRDAAIAAYVEAATRRPDWTEALLSLGSLLVEAGQGPSAVTVFRQAVASAPGNAECHFALGTALLGVGEAAGAATAFRGAIERSPEHLGARTNLASVLLSSGDASGAVEQLTVVASARPEDASSLVNLGVALLGAGDGTQAAARFGQALAIDGSLVPAMRGRAKALLLMGDAASVRAAVEEAGRAVTATGGVDVGVLETLASAQAAAGNPDAARRTLESAIRVARVRAPGVVGVLEERLRALD